MANLNATLVILFSISMLAFATTGKETASNIQSSVSSMQNTVSMFPALGSVLLVIGIAFAGTGFWAFKQPAQPEKKNLRIFGLIAIVVGVLIIFSGVGMLLTGLMANSMFDVMGGMGAPMP